MEPIATPNSVRYQNLPATSDFVRFDTVHDSSLCQIVDWRCLHDAPELRRERCIQSFSLNLIVSGAFIHHDPEQDLVLQPGLVIFTRPGQPYRTTHPFGMGDRGCRILLGEELAVEALLNLRPDLAESLDSYRPGRPLIFRPPAGTFLRQSVLLARCRQDLEVDPLLYEETVLDLLATTLENSATADTRRSNSVRPSRRSSAKEQQRRWVEKTKAVLQKHYARSITLDQIAKQVHCSPFHLSRIFKREVGIPIHQYLMQLRLAIGVECLLEDKLDLEQIAYDIGFSSHSHFSSTFNKVFGLSPKDARKLSRS